MNILSFLNFKARAWALDVVKFISFISFSIVSYILSLNMYLLMADGPADTWIMIGINTALEAFKIYSIIMRNTYLYFSKIGHALFSLKELKRKAFFHFITYLLVASVSITASLGFTLTIADKFNARRVSNTDFTTQIQGRIDLIRSYENQITAYDVQIQNLQTEAAKLSENFITRKQQLLAQVNEYINKRDNILDKQNIEKMKIEELKLKEAESRSFVARSMFELIGEIFHIPSSVVMILLLGTASFLIELGAFSTAPKILSIDTEAIENPKNKKEKAPSVKKSNSSLRTSKKASLQINIPSKISESLKKENSLKDLSETPTQPPIVAVPDSSTDNVLKKPISSPLKEEKQNENVPVRKVISDIEKFIDALFQNGNFPYLKDRDIAAQEAGLVAEKAPLALQYFKTLMSTRGPTGYPLIEFRKNTSKWYPNYTSEVIKNLLITKGLHT